MTLPIDTLYAWNLILQSAQQCGVTVIMPCELANGTIGQLYWFPNDGAARFANQFTQDLSELPAAVVFRPDFNTVVVRLPAGHSEHLAYVATLDPKRLN